MLWHQGSRSTEYFSRWIELKESLIEMAGRLESEEEEGVLLREASETREVSELKRRILQRLASLRAEGGNHL